MEVEIFPVLIERQGVDDSCYLVRAYNRFITVGKNFSRALEVLIKMHVCLNAKAANDVMGSFKNYWLAAIGCTTKDEVANSLLRKITQARIKHLEEGKKMEDEKNVEDGEKTEGGKNVEDGEKMEGGQNVEDEEKRT